MKIILAKYLIAMVAMIAFSCAGEEGEIGPQGQPGETGDQGSKGADFNQFYKMGYVEGTIKGIGTDGTSTNEQFKFEYVQDTIQTFEMSGNEKFFTLKRQSLQGKSNIEFTLKMNTDGTVTAKGLFLNIVKSLNTTDALQIRIIPHTKNNKSFVRAMSMENNKKYHFSNDATGNIQMISLPFSNYLVLAQDYKYQIDYSLVTGNLNNIYTKENGVSVKIISGPVFELYNNIKLVNDTNLGAVIFIDAATGEKLHEIIPDIPADNLNITNYVENSLTGEVTFDYEVSISKYRGVIANGFNSTGQDLIITGKFSSGNNVYRNIVSRVASN